MAIRLITKGLGGSAFDLIRQGFLATVLQKVKQYLISFLNLFKKQNIEYESAVNVHLDLKSKLYYTNNVITELELVYNSFLNTNIVLKSRLTKTIVSLFSELKEVFDMKEEINIESRIGGINVNLQSEFIEVITI